MKKYILISVVLLTHSLSYGGEEAAEREYVWHDCIMIARKNNPELLSAREKIDQYRADEGTIRSSMLPQVSTDVSRSQSGGSSVKKSDNFAYGITGKQLLFDGMKTYYDTKQAGKKVDYFLYEYRVTESNVRLNLRSAFIQLLKSQESLSIKNEIAGRRNQNLELVKLRHIAGREHIGSLLMARADLARAEFELSQAKRNITLFQRLLSREMGLKEFMPLRVSGDFKINEPLFPKPDFSRLIKTNPLLAQMIQLRESAGYNLKSAISGNSPRVYGSLAMGRTGNQWPPSEKEWSMGLEMTFSLFEGGRQYYGLSKAESELRQIEQDARSVRDKVLFTLEEKWTRYKNGMEYVDVQSQYLKAAEERSKIASAQYSVGLISFDNWVIIEDALVNAMNNYLEARTQSLTGEAEWIQAKGETLEYDR